ncbi:hypothetical protein ACKUB1_17120 [Methanospirillum stamsii]|nr:hypothetical protein [Methanospirillum stamsii]
MISGTHDSIRGQHPYSRSMDDPWNFSRRIGGGEEEGREVYDESEGSTTK